MTPRSPFRNLPEDDGWPSQRPGSVRPVRPGMRPIKDGWPKPCCHPAHNPPTMIVIPPGHEYVHVCPGCGATAILRGSNVTLSV